MSQAFERIACGQGHELASLPNDSKDVIVVSTGFDPGEESRSHPPRDCQLTASSIYLLEECERLLRFGGLLFVYGRPDELAIWGERLSLMRDGTRRMAFKYWIALDLDDMPRGRFLKPTHRGLLLYMKARPGHKTPPKFRLDTNAVRVPHSFCVACGLNVKDWGGKKHLMNPRGAALSDVWRDLPRRPIHDSVIADDVLNRIGLLTNAGAGNSLHVVQQSRGVGAGDDRSTLRLIADEPPQVLKVKKLTSLTGNHVYHGDCVSFLQRVKSLHPNGIFDLAFADPPYNLEKSYGHWNDALAEQHYLDWCEAWLEGMADTLKPGGSLLVLNLPKWAIHHAAFLNRRLEFRHWIVWDALSDPRGKLMPAHYALLYYTKPGGEPVFNYDATYHRSGGSAERRHLDHKELAALYRGAATGAGDLVRPPDSPKYCLRANCIKERKRVGDDEKVELSDIWLDIHRIKHKRDRDAHPCQLPGKLLERIMVLTTRPGGLVFDPFCGAGTTAIAAAKLDRKFVVVDLDPDYVRITRQKLAAMSRNETNGELTVPRDSIKRPRGFGSKKAIEIYLQDLARKLGRVPTEDDVAADRPEILSQIDLTYATRSAAFKRSRVVLEKSR